MFAAVKVRILYFKVKLYSKNILFLLYKDVRVICYL